MRFFYAPYLCAYLQKKKYLTTIYNTADKTTLNVPDNYICEADAVQAKKKQPDVRINPNGTSA